MFEKVKEKMTKNAVNDLINTPIPVTQTIVYGTAIVIAVFLLTHKVKVILIFE
jgi:hypothetical protein